jgi:hypothetical protein
MRKRIGIGSIIAFLIIGSSSISAASSVRKPECNNLTEVTGVLTSMPATLSIETVVLHLGPRWLMKITPSPSDYDADGTLETIIAELHGLVETTITVDGHLHEDGSLSVF